MTPIIVFALLILVAVCATLYIMLLSSARDIEALEDFIVELDDSTGREPGAYVMVGAVRTQLAEEADDIREMRKESVDE